MFKAAVSSQYSYVMNRVAEEKTRGNAVSKIISHYCVILALFGTGFERKKNTDFLQAAASRAGCKKVSFH